VATRRQAAELARQLLPRVRGSSARARWAAGAGLAVVVALLVAVLVLREEPAPQARERHYRDVSACLVTGDKGIADPAAAPVWAGMQDASTAHRIQVRYLALAGPQTEANAAAYLNSLAQGGCGMVLAVGGPTSAAVSRAAPRHRDVAFVVVGRGRSMSNVTVVPAADDTRAQIARLVGDHLR